MRVAIVQMTSHQDVMENLGWIETQLNQTDLTQVDWLLLPEMFAQLGKESSARVLSEEGFDDEIGQRVKQWAKKFNLWIVAGTVAVKTSTQDKPFSRTMVIDHSGAIVAHYDKIHLFDALLKDTHQQYRESDIYSAGDRTVVFDTPWGRIGLAVCYDLRFPELFRALNDQGAQAVMVPSAFTEVTGVAHWEVLCRARAIENGYFLVCSNQCGQHTEKRFSWGHSLLVDPWGEVIDIGKKPRISVVELALSKVDNVRNQLPVNHHRRL